MNRFPRAPALVIDTLLVLLALFDALYLGYRIAPEQVVLTSVAALLLFLRRKLPWLSFAAALLAHTFASALLVCVIALFSVAEREQRKWATAVAGVAVFAANLYQAGRPVDTENLIIWLIFSIATTAAPIALGMLVRTRAVLSQRVRELHEARESEVRHVEAEVLAVERARIAREMHDVVSHQVSMIAVQAGALQVRATDQEAVATAKLIRSLAVRTLDELRHMVAVLRAPGSDSGQLAPQPRLSDLAELVQGSAIPATLDMRIECDLSAAAQRTIYRTVQEALTNIRKHAPGASACIVGEVEGDEVVLRIRNSSGSGTSMALPSSGQGIVGLRERAELLGGQLFAEHETGGGFAVTLRLPVAATQVSPDGGDSQLRERDETQ